MGPQVPVIMLGNIVFDWAIGLTPGVGDFLDMGFRQNVRNVKLLEKAARKQGLIPAAVPTQECIPKIAKAYHKNK